MTSSVFPHKYNTIMKKTHSCLNLYLGERCRRLRRSDGYPGTYTDTAMKLNESFQYTLEGIDDAQQYTNAISMAAASASYFASSD